MKVFVIVLLLLGAVGLSACQPDVAAIDARAEMGALAPEIVLPKLENGQPGAVVKLSELRGKPVVLNFWATWCKPCREEFPALDEVFREYRATRDLQVIAVNVQDVATTETMQQFVADTGVLFPIWLDAEGVTNRAYNIKALPTTVFIDRSGVIRQIRLGGPLTREYIEAQLTKIF